MGASRPILVDPHVALTFAWWALGCQAAILVVALVRFATLHLRARARNAVPPDGRKFAHDFTLSASAFAVGVSMLLSLTDELPWAISIMLLVLFFVGLFAARR